MPREAEESYVEMLIAKMQEAAGAIREMATQKCEHQCELAELEAKADQLKSEIIARETGPDGIINGSNETIRKGQIPQALNTSSEYRAMVTRSSDLRGEIMKLDVDLNEALALMGIRRQELDYRVAKLKYLWGLERKTP